MPDDRGRGDGYPAEPWRLVGDMYASVWRVPVREVPGWRLPRGVRPLVLLGRATVVTFWVDYRPGGVLSYRELLVALAVTHRRRVAATAVAAWVDDARSLRGGRELWGIPKELATFAFAAEGARHTAEMTSENGDTARGVHRLGRCLPGRLAARAHLVQEAGGETVRVPMRVSGRPCAARARLTAGEDGPLAFLDGRTPTVTLALRDFRFTFGHRAPR